MKILHLDPDPYPLEAGHLLEAVGGVTYHPCREQEEFLRSLGEADYEAMFLGLGLSLNREALESAPHLRIVVTPTTGLAHLDVDEVARRGIVLLSLKGETALLREITSTAEHGWGLAIRRGAWTRCPWSPGISWRPTCSRSTSSAMGREPGSTRRRKARAGPAPSAPPWTSSKAAG